ncbi:hypothetical protein V495_02132 [Pseudogymnoascus sp. VKM F-4514 (FW-929)]|nr:hypothetical protein V495_02132 [Pseudogymnoascus sp. VKM F-4514 (FW-929)]
MPRWRVFDVDVETGWLVYSDQRDVQFGHLPGMRPRVPTWHEEPYFGLADVQSITLSASKDFALLTWLDSQGRHNVQVSSLNPDDDRDAFYHLRPPRSPENTTIRCACAAPLNSPYTFAIGSDDCPILVLDQEMNQVSSPSGPSSPTLALTFLAESPHVLLAGKRSGQIPLVDLRVEGGGRGGIRHSASVARVAQVGENAVVVGGLRDTMCVYDLRFLKEKEKGKKKEATRPVVRMWEHRNETRHDVDLAVDRGTGLVAAAQVEGGGGVRVFDVQSGAEVGYPLTTALLGGEVRIPTLDGHVDVKVATGTGAGDKITLSGMGMKKLNARRAGNGDLKVEGEVCGGEYGVGVVG